MSRILRAVALLCLVGMFMTCAVDAKRPRTKEDKLRDDWRKNWCGKNSDNSLVDCYDVLGLDKTADHDAKEVKKAYRALSRELHPDKNPNNDTAEELQAAVNTAYEILSDDDLRKDYLAVVEAKRKFGSPQEHPIFAVLLMLAFFFSVWHYKNIQTYNDTRKKALDIPRVQARVKQFLQTQADAAAKKSGKKAKKIKLDGTDINIESKDLQAIITALDIKMPAYWLGHKPTPQDTLSNILSSPAKLFGGSKAADKTE